MQRAGIWAGRKSAFAAVGRLSPAYIVQDGVVPRTALGDVLARISALSAEAGIRVANVFHAGDGNLHPLVLYNDAVPGETEAAEVLSGAILDTCIEYGGSITGEHGVGRGQIPVYAENVQRRRPGHDAAGPLRLRPGVALQSGQDLPDPAAVRRGPRSPPRSAPRRGRRPGDLLMRSVTDAAYPGSLPARATPAAMAAGPAPAYQPRASHDHVHSARSAARAARRRE